MKRLFVAQVSSAGHRTPMSEQVLALPGCDHCSWQSGFCATLASSCHELLDRQAEKAHVRCSISGLGGKRGPVSLRVPQT